MRLTQPLRSKLASSFPWLSELKSAQLQRIARATGIQSSGTKAVLAARIERELGGLHQAGYPGSSGSRTGAGEELRILSVDMGIRNLAFAHLHVPSFSPSPSPSGRYVLPAPELTAWHRLAVSEVGDLDLGSPYHKPQSGRYPDHRPRPSSTILEHQDHTTTSIQALAEQQNTASEANDLQLETGNGNGNGNETFSPAHYAQAAYTLISTLLRVYNPTHILIERQRFRSGGGSAVQEWTLRVGVLEGMLYAVLQTLRAERGGDISRIRVHGVEPRRVVGYWGGEGAVATAEPELKKRVGVSAREVKKGKIDLVGRWLDAAVALGGVGADVKGGRGMALNGIVIPEERGEVRELAGKYLKKWRGEKVPRGGKKRNGQYGDDVGKLDDLADCLLQGVTWLEWEVMKGRLARDGIAALESMR